MNDTDARLWHPWLRINRVLRVMRHTRWSTEAWSLVMIEFRKAVALRGDSPNDLLCSSLMDWGSLSFRFTLALAQFARWLYRGQRPNALARVLNRGAAAVFARGVAPNYLVTLELTGRRSGRTISLPLVMTVRDRERYLVSNHGADVAWVQNVKAAAGRAVLRHGRTEHVRLEEIAIEKRAPVVKAHLRRAPGARPHIPVDKDAPLEEFEAIATRIPVFRVLCAGETVIQTVGRR